MLYASNSSCVSPEGSFPPSAVIQKELALSTKPQERVKSVKHLQPGTSGVRGSQGVTVFLLHEATLLEW